MADTSRTAAQLKTLFADNVIGAISELDLRDFVESVFQFGGLRMALTDTPAGQSIGTAYEKLTQFQSVAGSSSTFVTPSAANDNFTIVKGGTFAILASLSFSGSNNSEWDGSIFVGGVDLDICSFKRKLSSAGDVGSATAFDCVTFADGDVVDYRLKADAAAKTFTLETGSFFLFRIG